MCIFIRTTRYIRCSKTLLLEREKEALLNESEALLKISQYVGFSANLLRTRESVINSNLSVTPKRGLNEPNEVNNTATSMHGVNSYQT